MSLRPLTLIVLMLAASPVAAEESGAIRLFAPVPNGSSPAEQLPVEQISVSPAEAIRLFSPAPSAPTPSPPAAPAIRGAVRERVPAGERSWTVAQP